jgi:protein arginine kinase
MFEKMVKSSCSWLSGTGEASKVVLATRVRLARNIAGCLYPAGADESTREKIVGYFESAFAESKLLGQGRFLKSSEISPLDRDFLVERHLMSPMFMQDEDARALFLSDDRQVSIMVNEEDHIRLQALVQGLNPDEAMRRVGVFDNEISRYLEYDYDPDFGFLTSCPTNVGTGMRASALIHLPGLVITKEIDRLVTKITKMNIAVRGFYGEGTDVLGNLFQVSNQKTLGTSEKEIIESIINVCQFIIENEASARDRLLEEASEQIKDKIWRSYGILEYARVLSSDEVMNLLSALRLGAAMELIDKVDIPLINELLILSQPAHLQKYFDEDMDQEQRDIVRARIIRDRLQNYRSKKSEK